MQQKFSTALDNFNEQIDKQKSTLAEQFNQQKRAVGYKADL
jgi:hypothetical protein